MNFIALFAIVAFVAWRGGKWMESYTRSSANARRHRNAYWSSMKYSAINSTFTIAAIIAILLGIAVASASCCPVKKNTVVQTEPCFVGVYCMDTMPADAGPGDQ